MNFRRAQFSLRWLLFTTTLTAIVLAWFARPRPPVTVEANGLQIEARREKVPRGKDAFGNTVVKETGVGRCACSIGMAARLSPAKWQPARRRERGGCIIPMAVQRSA